MTSTFVARVGPLHNCLLFHYARDLLFVTVRKRHTFCTSLIILDETT